MGSHELENRISQLELELNNLKAVKSSEANIAENHYHLLFENSLDGFAYCNVNFTLPN